MWDGLLTLLLLCSVMGAASFLAGLLPLSFSLSQRQLRLITALGTGVLVGTSLIVIIPEGIETLYSASGSSHGHHERSVATVGQSHLLGAKHAVDIAWSQKTPRDGLPETWEVKVPVEPSVSDFRTGPDDGYKAAEELAKQHGPIQPEHEEQSSLPPSEQRVQGGADKHDDTRNPHAYVGIALISGFILMYLIDTLPKKASSSSQPQRFQINLTSFSLSRGSEPAPAETPSTPNQESFSQPQRTGSSRPSSTTVGLVIHAAADGIALGASSTTTSRLSFIIFIALMIHKAPAAFGLTSVLLKQGLSKRAARAHLIVFSAAAPVGALLTWATANLFGYSGLPESTSTEFATGVLLLFSGGTFLYVAMHTMQESGSSGHEHGGQNGYAEVPMCEQAGPATKAGNEGGVGDALVTVAGMLLPLLTQFGHAH